jgi:hypothetical protein
MRLKADGSFLEPSAFCSVFTSGAQLLRFDGDGGDDNDDDE